MLITKLNLDRLNKEKKEADLIGSEYEKRNWDLFTVLVIEGDSNSISRLITKKNFQRLCKNHDIWINVDEKLIDHFSELLRCGVKKIVLPFHLKYRFNLEIPASRVIWRVKYDNNFNNIIKKISAEVSEIIETPYLNSMIPIIFQFSEEEISHLKLERLLKSIKSTIKNPVYVDTGRLSKVIDKRRFREFNFIINSKNCVIDSNLDDIFLNLLDFEKAGGLIPTIVRDTIGNILMLAYSSKESLKKAIKLRRGVYYSRSRQKLWIKGESSENTQELLKIQFDCDKDSLIFTVKQTNFACHLGRYSCFGDEKFSIQSLYEIINDRVRNSSREESFTKRISVNQSNVLEKIKEEAIEVLNFIDTENLVWEIADLSYFILILMFLNDITPSDVLNELWRRRK